MAFWSPKPSRRVFDLEERVESLRRTVDGLVYDVAELQRRLRRVVWREDKAEERAAHGNGAGDAAAATTDPISAEILARRARGARRPPQE